MGALRLPLIIFWVRRRPVYFFWFLSGTFFGTPWVMFCHHKDNHSWAVTILKHILFFSWMSKECQATNQMSFVECTKQLTTTTPEPTWTAGQRFENFSFVQLFSCKNYHIFLWSKSCQEYKESLVARACGPKNGSKNKQKKSWIL